jgi:lysophospholipase L1-like esterase
LAILEGLVRIYSPFDLRLRGDKIVLPVDRTYCYKNDTIRGLDDIIINKRNPLGFRGAEPPKNFSKYLTIVTVGGSTTECSYITEGKTWPDLVGNKLKNDFPHLWLNNAGLDGHSTFGHLVLMKDYIAKLKPKVVLFLIGINDIGINDLTDYDRENLGILTFTSGKGMLKAISAHSELLSLGLNFYRYTLAKSRGLSASDQIDLATMGQINLDRAYCEKMKTLQQEKYLPGYETRLRKLIKIVKQNSIEPVFITQPLIFGNTKDNITSIDLANIKIGPDMSGELEWEILELYNDVTRRVGKEEGIMVIDLASKMPKSSIYFYDADHFTNKGAEKVAAIIYEYLSPFLSAKFARFKGN